MLRTYRDRGVGKAVAFAIMLAGCGSVPISPATPSDEPWTNYTIGAERHAATGDTMVEWIGRAKMLRGYVMTTPVTVEGLGRQPPSDAGVWPARYTYHGPCPGGRYVLTNEAFFREQLGIIVGADGSIPCAAVVLQIEGAKAGREWSVPSAVVGTTPFRTVPYLADLTQSPIKWELIYSGRSGDELTIAYREYSALPDGTFARPAFAQVLHYDLSTSSRVVFRAMELQILEASNVGVRFRVLRDAEGIAPGAVPSLDRATP